MITCGRDGQWDTEVPKCLKKRESLCLFKLKIHFHFVTMQKIVIAFVFAVTLFIVFYKIQVTSQSVTQQFHLPRQVFPQTVIKNT